MFTRFSDLVSCCDTCTCIIHTRCCAVVSSTCCVTVCYSVLQCVAVCCSVSQCALILLKHLTIWSNDLKTVLTAHTHVKYADLIARSYVTPKDCRFQHRQAHTHAHTHTHTHTHTHSHTHTHTHTHTHDTNTPTRPWLMRVTESILRPQLRSFFYQPIFRNGEFELWFTDKWGLYFSWSFFEKSCSIIWMKHWLTEDSVRRLGARRRGAAPKLPSANRVVPCHQGRPCSDGARQIWRFAAVRPIHSTVQVMLTFKFPSRNFASEKLFETVLRRDENRSG